MDTFTKIDLHIHSSASSNKDGALVENNTEENIKTLIDRLIEQEVNMVSITDHNTFDYKLYSKLKNEELSKNCINKVLPGVELNVTVDDKDVHVICIFDDKDDDKVKEINKILNNSTPPYSTDTFDTVLRNIKLNVVVIVHQKSDPLALRQNSSLGQCGPEKFNELIGIGYFDALEFPSSKVDGMLQGYLYRENLNNIASLSGSDCHVWSVYPKNRNNSDQLPANTYIRSLPSFKGLVMAITEPSRISNCQGNLNRGRFCQESLDVEINGITHQIDLSRRINAIIGDNSLGKSMILNLMTNTRQSPVIEKGYQKFLLKNEIKLLNKFKEETFDYYGQGDIREKFDKDGAKLSIQFSDKFKSISINKYKEQIKVVLQKMVLKWQNNSDICMANSKINNGQIIIPYRADSIYHLTVDMNLEKLNTIDSGYIDFYDESITVLNKIIDSDYTEPADIEIINNNINTLKTLKNKYSKKKEEIDLQNNIINTLIKVSNSYNDKVSSMSGQEGKLLLAFKEMSLEAAKTIAKAASINNTPINFCLDDFETIIINPEKNSVGQYKFVSSVVNEHIDKECLSTCVLALFNKRNINTIEELMKLTLERVENNFLISIKNEKEGNTGDKFIEGVIDQFEHTYLMSVNKIIKSEQECDEGNSAGTNAIIYLDLVSQDLEKRMLILDQPEDYVAQAKIGTDLLSILQRIANGRQIIIVTHNPQLVVNLDVDNVIALSTKNNKICINSGSLEYEDDEVNILDEVSKILDGGNDIIKKRWRRYDKTANNN